MEFSNELKLALNTVSQQIAPDAGEVDSEEMAELCVDAGRMEMFGHEAAQNEASALIKEHGYGKFLKEAANHVRR